MENSNKKTQKTITVKANKNGRHVMPLLNVLRVILIPILFLVRPFKLHGNKKVKDGACIYISNHYSALDPIYPAATTWEGIHYISKREAFENPILGFFLRRIKALSANRDGTDARIVLDSLKCLRNGEKLAIYPEGSRNKTNDEIRPFKHGAAMMAIRTKTPIIPIVIVKRPKFFRVTHVLVGEPVELLEYYNRKLTDSDYEVVEEKLRELLVKMREEFLNKNNNK